MDERRRAVLPELEELRRAKNEASKRIGELQRSGGDASEAIAEVRGASAREKDLDEELRELEERRTQALGALPNLPDPTAPPEDEVLREEGEAGATGRDHLDLLGDLVDMEAGARVAGSRFAYLKGPLVRLELALVQWVLTLLEEKGFTPVIPPVLVRGEALFGTGMLPDTEQQIYRVPDDDLYLAGTSEVPLASLHAGQILAASDLPLRYAGFSTCFRREAGAAGKDTKGVFRVHQFDKVEMFSFVDPAESQAEHERLLAIEEEIFQALGLPYRVVNIAVDDLGASAAKKYDLEAWLPGQGRYRELTSRLEHHRLPGPAPGRAPPGGGRGRGHAARAHPQRHGRGRGPHDHRRGGERPARRRQHRHPRGPASLRRPTGDRRGRLTRPPPTHMGNADDMLAVAASRAEALAAPGLDPRPRRKVAVLACMDTRIDLFPMLGLQRGDAHIIRNAGGLVTDDAIRSLSASQRLLGTEEIVVVMHDGCGLHGASEDEFAEALSADGVLPTWRLGTFEDVEETLRHGLARLSASRELPRRDHLRGFVFDPETGRLREVRPDPA